MGGLLTAGAIRGVSTLYGSAGGDMNIGALVNNVSITANQTISLASNNGVVISKVLTPSIDTSTVVPMNIGTVNAGLITIGRTGQNIVLNSNSLTANSFIM